MIYPEATQQFNRRQEALKKYEHWLEGLVSRKGKGYRTRVKFYRHVRHNKIFETEEEEYQYVMKFHRGHWLDLFEKGNMTKDELTTMYKFANEYGAMDY